MNTINENLLKEISNTYKEISKALKEIKKILLNPKFQKKRRRVSVEDSINDFFASLEDERRENKHTSYPPYSTERIVEDKNAD